MSQIKAGKNLLGRKKACINWETTACSWDTGWWYIYRSEKSWTSSDGMIVPNIWNYKKCSKPPTRTKVAVGQNLVPLVNIKIAGKWMCIPLKMVLICINMYWSIPMCFPLPAAVPSRQRYPSAPPSRRRRTGPPRTSAARGRSAASGTSRLGAAMGDFMVDFRGIFMVI